MNAIQSYDIIVRRPALPQKPIRISPPTLDQMRTDAAIVAAIARRDKEWSDAVRVAGGGVL